MKNVLSCAIQWSVLVLDLPRLFPCYEYVCMYTVCMYLLVLLCSSVCLPSTVKSMKFYGSSPNCCGTPPTTTYTQISMSTPRSLPLHSQKTSMYVCTLYILTANSLPPTGNLIQTLVGMWHDMYYIPIFQWSYISIPHVAVNSAPVPIS